MYATCGQFLEISLRRYNVKKKIADSVGLESNCADVVIWRDIIVYHCTRTILHSVFHIQVETDL